MGRPLPTCKSASGHPLTGPVHTVVLEATPFLLTWTPGDGLRGLRELGAPWVLSRDDRGTHVLILTGHGVPVGLPRLPR